MYYKLSTNLSRNIQQSEKIVSSTKRLHETFIKRFSYLYAYIRISSSSPNNTYFETMLKGCYSTF